MLDDMLYDLLPGGASPASADAPGVTLGFGGAGPLGAASPRPRAVVRRPGDGEVVVPRGISPSVVALDASVVGESGWCVPRRLSWQDTVPVVRSPTGRWVDVVASPSGRACCSFFVQTDDGLFAPYRLDDLDELRVAYDVDVSAGGQPYATCRPMPVGRPLVVLHLPGD